MARMNPRWTRRSLVKSALAGASGIAFARFAEAEEIAATPPAREYSLELYNTHTRETVDVIFRRGTVYDEAALASLDHVLRDHRNGQQRQMDPRLFDQLHSLAEAAGVPAKYEIISGYRSPESNAKMATPGSGVAKKSQHIEGRAIDVRLKGVSCADLRDLAIKAEKGGVGYYQRSDFVHIDTGRFRTWIG
jgi:uncharacterized protein YcbK (DUF882 family)